MQIEADIQFCEDVLNYKGQLPSGRNRVDLYRVGTVRRRSAQEDGTGASRGAASAPPRQQQDLQFASPGSAGRDGQPAEALLSAKPRNIEELWAVLESAPTGLPFEIDAGLLYGQEASFESDQQSSPPGSNRGVRDGAAREQPMGDFVVPAYRPASTGVGPGLQPPRESQVTLSPGQQESWLAGSSLSSSSKQPLVRSFTSPGAAEQGQKVTAELLRQGREERLQQLAQPRTGLWEACERRRTEQQHLELQQCTFAPQVGRPPARHKVPVGLPVEERLLAAAQSKTEALEQARRQLASAEVAECTFVPRLVTDPQHHLGHQERRPIHERLGDEQRRRSSKLAQARLLEVRWGPGAGTWAGCSLWLGSIVGCWQQLPGYCHWGSADWMA